MKKLLFAVFIFGSYLISAQASLNDYKYIVVPEKFDCFKKKNQYLTSTLVKHLFVKKGYNVVYENAKPQDLMANPCLGLKVDIDNTSSMFTTKTALQLKDCNSIEIMTTVLGRSKKKEYKAAYGEAIRNAFKSFDGLNYSYIPKNKEEAPVTVSFKNDVKKIEAPKTNIPQSKESTAVVVQEATTERQTYKNIEPVESNIKKAISNGEKGSVVSKKAVEVLYAQKIENGYQLVDSTPKIRLKLFESSMPDYYMAKADNKDGVVYKKADKWFFEYYEGTQRVVEELEIKF